MEIETKTPRRAPRPPRKKGWRQVQASETTKPQPYFQTKKVVIANGLVTWRIENAAYLIEQSKLVNDSYVETNGFWLHGKLWFITFYPFSGDISICLVTNATHVCKFSVDSKIVSKTLRENCIFSRGATYGFQTFLTPEQVATEIGEDGSWTFIITISDDESNNDLMEE